MQQGSLRNHGNVLVVEWIVRLFGYLLRPSGQSDRVVRLDTKTGNVTEYPLPKFTNIRKVYVDNSTTPVTFWAGSNHGASIVRVEPLD